MSKQELKDTLSIRQVISTNQANLKDQVVSINRCTKVVKGGKNLSFSALVVVGDQGGHAGFGMGKAREAVSYTHLDVYKRQFFACFAKGINSASVS